MIVPFALVPNWPGAGLVTSATLYQRLIVRCDRERFGFPMRFARLPVKETPNAEGVSLNQLVVAKLALHLQVK